MRVAGRWSAVRAGATIALVSALAGCGTGGAMRLYTNPKADMTFYKQVAVVPFANLTSDRYAGERVGRAFMTELVISDRFHVVEDGVFRKALERVGAEANAQGQYESEKLRQAAGALEIQGMVRGTVTDLQLQHFGTNDLPVVSFDVEMIDVQSGDTVWRASITRRGRTRTPLIGRTSTDTFGRLVQESCRELVDHLAHKAF